MKFSSIYLNISRNYRRLAAFFVAAGLTVLSASSCGIIEMRDSADLSGETDMAIKSNIPDSMLAQAERKNEFTISEEETKAETEKPAADEEVTRVSVVLSGESVFDKNVIADAANRASDTKDYSFLMMYSGVYKYISGADLSVGICSTPIVSDYNGTGAPCDALESMQLLGYDAIGLTGAHMLDGGNSAIGDSLENYYDAGIMNYGIYSDLEDYNNIRILNRENINIALLSVSGSSYASGNSSASGYIVPGFDDEEALHKWIEYADFISDIVIVSVDWGELASDTVSSEQSRLAMMMAEAGADVIFGAGGSLQKVEYLDTNDGTKTVCAYSLGNILSVNKSGETELSEKTSSEKNEAPAEDGASDDKGSYIQTNDELGGLLSFDIIIEEDSISINNLSVIPVCTYYTVDNDGISDIHSTTLSGYSDMISSVSLPESSADGSSNGAVSDNKALQVYDKASADSLKSKYEAVIPAEMRR